MAGKEHLHNFPVGERLKSKKLIGELFQKGSSFSFYPFRIIYLQQLGASQPRQLLISIPRKRYKRAVDRNHLKRCIREAWRHHKDALHQKALPITVAIIYIGKDKLPQTTIEQKLKGVIRRLSKQLPQNTSA